MVVFPSWPQSMTTYYHVYAAMFAPGKKVSIFVATFLTLYVFSTHPRSYVFLPPQLFVFHTVSRSQPVHFVQCATVGSFKAHWLETLYNMFTFCCLFLLPLLIMVFCYGKILVEISRKMKKAEGEGKRHLRL